MVCELCWRRGSSDSNHVSHPHLAYITLHCGPVFVSVWAWVCVWYGWVGKRVWWPSSSLNAGVIFIPTPIWSHRNSHYKKPGTMRDAIVQEVIVKTIQITFYIHIRLAVSLNNMFKCSIHKLYGLLEFVFSRELCPLVVCGIKNLLYNCFVRDVFIPAIRKASFPTVPNYNPRYHTDPQLMSDDCTRKPQLWLEGGGFWLWGPAAGASGSSLHGSRWLLCPRDLAEWWEGQQVKASVHQLLAPLADFGACWLWLWLRLWLWK